MATLKAKEIHGMSIEEIDAQLKDLYKRKMKIQSDIAAGIASESIGNLRKIKRNIARLLTIKHQKEKSK